MIVRTVVLLAMIAFGSACSTMPQRDREAIRDCPPGQVLVCESRGEPTRPGDEIPEYEYCRCEIVQL